MNTTQARKITVALLLTLIAVGLHMYLANKHYALKFGTGGGPSMCNINEKLNCDAVAASSYSSLFGVPIAVFGAAANFILALFLLIFRLGWTETREAVGRYSAWLTTLIAVASIGMGLVSMTLMSAYCVFCMAAYAISFVNLYLVLSSVPGTFSAIGEDLQGLVTSHKWVLFLFFCIPAGAVLTDASIIKSSGFAQLSRIAVDKVAQWKTNPSQSLDDTKGLVLAGQAATRMTIVEFADFRCPHCRHAYPTLHSFVQSHPDVKLVFKFYPLDGVCNPALKEQGGDGISCRLAETVYCAEKVNQSGWKAHNFFFDNQEKMVQISKAEEINAAYCADGGSGINCEALSQCIEANETKDAIRAMAEEGKAAGIQGTPAVFVNGKNLSYGQMLPILELAYKSL